MITTNLRVIIVVVVVVIGINNNSNLFQGESCNSNWQEGTRKRQRAVKMMTKARKKRRMENEVSSSPVIQQTANAL